MSKALGIGKWQTIGLFFIGVVVLGIVKTAGNPSSRAETGNQNLGELIENQELLVSLVEGDCMSYILESEVPFQSYNLTPISELWETTLAKLNEPIHSAFFFESDRYIAMWGYSDGIRICGLLTNSESTASRRLSVMGTEFLGFYNNQKSWEAHDRGNGSIGYEFDYFNELVGQEVTEVDIFFDQSIDGLTEIEGFLIKRTNLNVAGN